LVGQPRSTPSTGTSDKQLKNLVAKGFVSIGTSLFDILCHE
jgi:hypothetical protein